MCGIVGAVDWGNTEILRNMTLTLRHRGPDDMGLWESGTGESVWVGLGHCRLSILDLSAAGHQPMCNEDGRLWIVFNGEIYNFGPLREQLLEKGHRFRSRTDTETILHLYEDRGAECLKALRGMFALGIWDCERRELFLVRDRLGIKPLYYLERDGRLLFASELKAILRHPEVERRLDLQALDEYLSYLYVPPPRTIFAGIEELPPAHYLVWRDGRVVKKERYWELPEEALDGDEQDLADELRVHFEEAVRLRMISDVPLGAFLSGGIDSSSIVGAMARQVSYPVKTFTIGFSERARLYNELDYARAVADFYATDHHEIIVEPHVIELLPKMAEGFDQPFGNPTSFLVYLLSEFSRTHVTVALSGDAGDELFGGYPRYKGAALSSWYRKIPRWMRKATFERIAAWMPESVEGRHELRRFREFVQGCTLAPEEMYCSWVGYFTEEMKARLYSEETRCQLGAEEPYTFLKGLFQESRRRERREFFDQITAVDLQSFLPCNLLAYTDRMSMAHSLEVRVPFTDHKLVEFTTRLSHTLRLKGMQDKYIFKRAVGDTLPEAILKRRKIGFNPPMGIWLREELRDLVGDCLSEEVVERRGYFRFDFIRSLLDLHFAGKRDFSLHIWALIVFEMWHRAYLDP